ncbi:TetR/AcrR family transcriptional regulator [Amycolatopsis pithecellobii]|uniref:TetR family transcriptional regulator n=1 Tax=Amycolatopsis pithecellobii TaxID=664692 RepID=A0A6N7YMH6_9PSEU|nr:TetR/AcrR family transcriptional regulator [Amycolatopsis pithecellobii]MTD53068.1 TetR family transcriptional regulator [Amycolatopsis pithecellobii]
MVARRSSARTKGAAPAESPVEDTPEPEDEAGTSAPRRRRSKRRDLVLAQIYEEAARLFAERGYAGTTPQDIADAVGVSRQALYYYVRSKEEILAGLVAEMTSQIVQEMRRIVDLGLDEPETLRRLAAHMVTDRARNRTRFRMLDRSESALPPELAREFLQGRRDVLNLLVDVIKSGVAAGRFVTRDPRVAALSVIGMCNWVAWWFEPGPGHPVEPIADQIADSAVSTLRPLGPSTVSNDPAQLIAAMEAELAQLKKLTTGS